MLRGVPILLAAEGPSLLPLYIIAGLLLAIFLLVGLVTVWSYGTVWFHAYMSNARVSMWGHLKGVSRNGKVRPVRAVTPQEGRHA